MFLRFGKRSIMAREDLANPLGDGALTSEGTDLIRATLGFLSKNLWALRASIRFWDSAALVFCARSRARYFFMSSSASLLTKLPPAACAKHS